ncbi:DUF4834 family protein [Arenibacter certesii]|uniref:DUF4834 domain-containing protein n=1 Tax=Arenibacter certesii TaxID=228955 RepID=A0A918MIU3_9FLAO|nr:DUF4834 family protein [Arenibacter certesii]GGW26031.1 hypothetical protein GCM10007383_08750 [Arenibacter certesii]
MGFLKTLLIIILVYYALKFLAKWLGPILFRYAAKKTEKYFKEKFNGFPGPDQNEASHIGDVIIDKRPKKQRKPSNKVGEYIDFEEIE